MPRTVEQWLSAIEQAYCEGYRQAEDDHERHFDDRHIIPDESLMAHFRSSVSASYAREHAKAEGK